MGRLGVVLLLVATGVVGTAAAASTAARPSLSLAGLTVSATVEATRTVPSEARGSAGLAALPASVKARPLLRASRGVVYVPLRARRTETTAVMPPNATPYDEPAVCRPAAVTAAAAARLELRPVGTKVEVRLTVPGPAFVRCPGPRGVAPQAVRVLVARVPAAQLARPRSSVTLAGTARAIGSGWSRTYKTRATVTFVRR